MASARRRARKKISGAVRRGRMVGVGPISKSQRNCMNKKRYDSERIANIRASQMSAKFPNEPQSRSYKCPHCKGWHLTTKQ